MHEFCLKIFPEELSVLAIPRSPKIAILISSVFFRPTGIIAVSIELMGGAFCACLWKNQRPMIKASTESPGDKISGGEVHELV